MSNLAFGKHTEEPKISIQQKDLIQGWGRRLQSNRFRYSSYTHEQYQL